MFSDLGQDVYNIQMNSTFNRKDISRELTNLSLPIKMFYSTKDRLFSHRVLENFTDEHTHIKLISREGTSHMISLEDPKVLSNEIRDWMNL